MNRSTTIRAGGAAIRASARTRAILPCNSLNPIRRHAPEEEWIRDNTRGIGGPFDWPRDDFPFKVPAYEIVNIRAGISGSNWSLTAYVENVFDKNYYTGTQENFGLGGIRIRPHFAVWGLNLRLFSSK